MFSTKKNKAQIEFTHPEDIWKEMPVERNGIIHNLPLFQCGDTITGIVRLSVPSTKTHHTGIYMMLIGSIEKNKKKPFFFMELIQELAPEGNLQESQTFKFEFKNVQVKYESYNGFQVRLRYFVRLKMTQGQTNYHKDSEFWMIPPFSPPTVDTSVIKEIGIQDMVHIQVEYLRSKFHLRDVVIGRILFLLSRIKLEKIILGVIKREISGKTIKSQKIETFEILDGSPDKGDSIPIRLFLEQFPLTPTFNKVQKKFSVRYFLNLLLIDEQGKRYVTESEIFLYRNFTPKNVKIIRKVDQEK
ncbi:vacuolar protein sorting-associated protein [Anaeramoeba ignava]|uniref:Vacuolar protein sorting-associated protein n=1 Tax=Anaeramoeba ignava TaxID=1746090 RepID=A0A9Q0LW95_ANAIG|nr:vacuolar protein sorting-associated protein [Anaeramoeba ignava]